MASRHHPRRSPLKSIATETVFVRDHGLAERLAQNGVPFVRTRVAMVVHDYELAGSSFAHQSLRLGMKQHRRLIGVADRLERDRSFLAVRTKNDLESPYSAARHGPPSCS